MSIQNISFMGKSANTAVKKLAEKAETTYFGKEPVGEVAKIAKKAKNEVGVRTSGIESFLDSRQQVLKENIEDVSADKLAEAYKAAHGIV